jgi:DNA-binding transcriptional LysR family regulator
MSKNQGPWSKGSRAAERRLVPLSVWLCSDTTVGMSKADHSSRTAEVVCGRHHQAVGRELARHLIDACTRPGGVVTDVFTMSETVLVAAAEMGRLGVGCVPRFPVAQHLVGHLRQVLSAEQRGAVGVCP